MIEVTLIRSGEVTYKVRVGDKDVYHEDWSDIGSLIAMAGEALRGIDEVSLTREGLCLYVHVPADVPLEVLDQKAAAVFLRWKETRDK